MRNSVLEVLVVRFADIQEEICCRAVWGGWMGDTWVKVTRME